MARRNGSRPLSGRSATSRVDDVFGHSGVVGLDDGGGGFHRDRLDDCPDGSVKSVRTTWLMSTWMPVLVTAPKPGLRDADVVIADADKLDGVVAFLVSGGVIGILGSVVKSGDGGSGDDVSALIGNGADQRSVGGDLGERARAKQQDTRYQA